jgi:glycine betaine/proline transport system substrate-binding protein
MAENGKGGTTDMKKRTWKGVLALASLSIALLLVLAACGDDDDEKQLITFTDLDWPSAHIQTAIAAYIVEEGYGYPTDRVTLGTIPGFVALSSGDTQISMEIWLPHQQAIWDAAIADGTVLGVGKSLDDNWQSSYVIPGYTQDANPGLVSVLDLKKPEYQALFASIETGDKAYSVGCIPGWACEVINEEKIVGYGLEDHVELVNPGSASALDAVIRGAFEKEEDLLFYYWGPTAISADLDLRVLEEPAYTEACFESDHACGYPVAEVLVAINTSLNDTAPEIVEFLRKYDFTAAAQIAASTYMGDTGAEFDEVAVWWLKNQEAFWIDFVTSDAAEKIKEALAAS